MVAAAEYSISTQSKTVHALCVLHNFIRVHDPDDMDLTTQDEITCTPHAAEAGDFGGEIGSAEQKAALSRRDSIAKAMWHDYITYIGQNAR